MFRAIIATILAVLMSGCAWFYIPADEPRPLSTWFTFPTDAQLRDYARNHDPVPVSEAEAIASYNFLYSPPPGCEDDPVCKSDQVWATYRIGEYERERRKREARGRCMRELYSERRARLGIPQCTGE